MSRTSRRITYAGVWMIAGVMLVARGLPYIGWVSDPSVTALQGSSGWIALALALGVGFAKALLVFRKAAAKVIHRIDAQGEYAPIWSLFPPTTLLLIACMVALGMGIRTTDYDPHIKAWVIGVLYPGIGLSLVMGGWMIAPSIGTSCAASNTRRSDQEQDHG